MKKTLASRKKSYDKTRQHIKKWRNHFADKGLYCQSYDFSTNHVQLWELDHKEGWAPRYWCFWTVVLEKTLERLLASKEIKSVNPKGNRPCIFTGRTNADTEIPILWSPGSKSWLTRKDADGGKNWRQEKGWQRMIWLDRIINPVDMSLSKCQETVKDREPVTLQFMGSQKVRCDLATEQQQQQKW